MGRKKLQKYLTTDTTFGKWKVLRPDALFNEGKSPFSWRYICECSCPDNIIRSVSRKSLVAGKSKSCGCLNKEKTIEMLKARSKTNIIEEFSDFIRVYFFNAKDWYTDIDTEDYDKIKRHCWSLDKYTTRDLFYAVTRVKAGEVGVCGKKNVRMHQIILPTEEGFVPEHKDGNGLNNRKSNLRPATNSQNMMNTKLRKDNSSGHKGISWDTHKKKWHSYLDVGGKRIFSKYFIDKNKAVNARKEAEEKYHKEYSLINSRNREVT